MSSSKSNFALGSERGVQTTTTALTGTYDPKEMASILKIFLRNMEYVPLNIPSTNEPLEAAMRAEMDGRKIRCAQLERTLHLAASFSELVYHNHSFSEKKQIALANWYTIYVDDKIGKDVATYSTFEERFLRGQPHLDPVLDALAEQLLTMWGSYDTPCANSIVSALFLFVTSESMAPDLETVPLLHVAHRFPWFQRERTGVSEAFAFWNFPKSFKINVMEFIQAIPEMVFWISLVNDLLSFHKEELNGDKSNYVYIRASVENKSPLKVLAEMTDDVCLSQKVIHATLAGSPDALRAWKTYERGYIAWHLEQDRYKLKDIGL